jgi:hypothetical protein
MSSDHPVRWKAGYDHNMATIHTKLKRIKTLLKSVTKALASDQQAGLSINVKALHTQRRVVVVGLLLRIYFG